MTYGPPVTKQCEHCKKEYKCPNHRASKSRFCTIICRNKSGAFERIEYTCVGCDDKFMALPDHGADRRFCSRKCFLEDCVQPIDKECENCGGMFTAGKSPTVTRGDGRRLYCSNKCRVEDSRSFEEKPCVACGKLFYPGSAQKNEHQKTCSFECSAQFFSGANAHNFQGGVHIVKESDHKMILVGKREGYSSKYLSEHRLLIAKYLGRLLTRNEVVIHINNAGLDNRLSNLYLCESMSEYSKRKTGALSWPNKSNLEEYKEKQND
jgi:hypothetical protein